MYYSSNTVTLASKSAIAASVTPFALSNSNSPYLVDKIEINLHCNCVHVVEITYHPVGLLSESNSGMIP